MTVKGLSEYDHFDHGKYTTVGETWSVIQGPKYTWQMIPCDGILIQTPEGKQPCLFNRLMQRLFFGFVWKKIK